MKQTTLIFLTLSLSILLTACGGNKTEQVEVVSMEDLMGDDGGQNTDTTNIEIDSVVQNQSVLDELVANMSSTYDTLTLIENHVFDRYGFNTSQKIEFAGKKDVAYGKSNMVTPKAEFYLYNFSDSLKLNNAFYNWLDCFGSDCNEVKLNQDIEAVKTPPSFTLVYDTTLISVQYLCEHDKNDWQSFQDSIVNHYGNNYRYRIDVECGGPLKWK